MMSALPPITSNVSSPGVASPATPTSTPPPTESKARNVFVDF